MATNKDFFLTYKDGTPLISDSYSNLNGFVKSFDINELAIGGSLDIELRLYGGSKLEIVKPWTPTDTEKAPSTINFSRIGYTLNDDIQYVLLLFDLSESFLNNYEKNINYADPVTRTMLDSLKVSVSLGGVNLDSYNYLAGDISSDYITVNGNEVVGVLFTSNTNIQQTLKLASTAQVKFLVYNYLPKIIDGQQEFIPIKISLSISGELDNNLTAKQIGNVFPFTKIEEIAQILELQKREFSENENAHLQTNENFNNVAKKTTYLKYFNMPISDANIRYADAFGVYFEILNSFHSFSFSRLFSFKQEYSENTGNLITPYKIGKHVLEYKPDLLVRDALPKVIQIKNSWEGNLSSISYSQYYEFRQLEDVYNEISGFVHHILWNFSEENYSLRERAINRKLYLLKLKNILLNMLFSKPDEDVSITNHYLREDIYKTFYKTYNYNEYGQATEPLNYTGRFLHNMFIRSGFFLVDLLWFVNDGELTYKDEENYRYYKYLDEHVLSKSKPYNILAFPKMDAITGYELTESFDSLMGYLSMIKAVIFTIHFLKIENLIKNNKKWSDRYFSFLAITREILNNLSKYMSFINVFDPEKPTTGDEFVFPESKTSLENYSLSDIAYTLSLLDTFTQYLSLSNTIKYSTALNYQFWHIIEKDFLLNSVEFGDNRLIVTNKTEASETKSLNYVNIKSLLNYGLIDSIITSYGSTISLKTRIMTNI